MYQSLNIKEEEYRMIEEELFHFQDMLEYGDDIEVGMTLQHTEKVLGCMRLSFYFFHRFVKPFGIDLETLCEAASFDNQNRVKAIKQCREKFKLRKEKK